MPSDRFKIDPNLTGNLTAEYEALQNDLEQAKALAADYQNQLSDKSNDVAALKITLEKTVADLERLQAHIVALRQERHNLANEVMKIVLLEAKLANLTEENKRLKEANDRQAQVAKDTREYIDARESRGARREFIPVEFDEPKGLEIVPTEATPRAPGPFRPR